MAKAKKPVVEVNEEFAFINKKPKTRQELVKFYKDLNRELRKRDGHSIVVGPKR